MAEKSSVQIKFDEMVKESFVKILKPLGFKKQAYTFYLEQEGFGKVVNLQRDQGNSADDISFTINFGLYVPEYYKAKFPLLKAPTFPKESNCAIRYRVGELTGGEEKWFDIKKATEVTTLIKQMTKFLDKEILPFFNKYPNKKAILNNIASENEPLVALIVLAENGYKEKAYQQYKLLVKAEKDPKSDYLPYLFEMAKHYGLKT